MFIARVCAEIPKYSFTDTFDTSDIGMYVTLYTRCNQSIFISIKCNIISWAVYFLMNDRLMCLNMNEECCLAVDFSLYFFLQCIYRCAVLVWNSLVVFVHSAHCHCFDSFLCRYFVFVSSPTSSFIHKWIFVKWMQTIAYNNYVAMKWWRKLSEIRYSSSPKYI